MYREGDGRGNTPLEHQAKQQIMVAFDLMVEETDQIKLNALWKQVHANEAILTSEVRRRIEQCYNTSIKRS